MGSDMDLQAIRIFVEVLRLGSFAAVARQHAVDPSTVSRTVAVLEEQLGFRLLQRSTRRLTATEAGVRYFERVQPLLDELDRAESEARDIVAAPSGRLRVTASVAFGATVVVPRLARLRALHPALDIELMLSDQIVDVVAERIDIAIRLGARLDTGLVGTRLMQTRYHVCASPDYIARNGKPARPERLEDHDCLLFPYQGFRTQWRFRSRGGAVTEVPVKGGIVISNALALHRAALEGLGPVLLADWLVGADLKHGRLVNLFPGYEVTATAFSTAAWILYPSRSYVPLKVRAFIDFMKAETSAKGARRA